MQIGTSLRQPVETTTAANLVLPQIKHNQRPPIQTGLMNGSAASTAQFVQNPLVNLVRMMMKSIDRVSPALAARITYALISSPPRYRASAAESVLRASAQKWRLPFQNGWLQCYRWGQGNPGPVCLFVHCWGGRGTQAETMIRQLTQAGLNVVSFDHPAHGQSSGNTAEMVRMSAAIAAVIQDIGPVDTLIGHSLGVAAAAIALRDHDLPVTRLVSISSLTHCTWFTEVIADYLGISRATVARARKYVDQSYARPVGWEELSVVNMLSNLSIPILLVHDCDDQEIPFEHALKISYALPAAQFLATTGLGHRRVLKDKNVIDLVAQFAHQSRSAA
jgi:pimeloyl-ACP methyl ester carboxylesterase